MAGVSYHKQTKRWAATASVQGKRKHIGLFDSKEEAQVARDAFRAANPVHAARTPLPTDTPYEAQPELIRKVFEYRDGHLYWKVSFAQIRSGDRLGYLDTRRGYYVARLFNRTQQVHRIVFAWHFGRWPSNQIDHINRNRADNRIENLREATPAENSQNVRWGARTRTGVQGVYPTPHGRYQAMICINKKLKHLGCFLTIEEAAAAYAEAKRKYHPFAADYQKEAA